MPFLGLFGSQFDHLGIRKRKVRCGLCVFLMPKFSILHEMMFLAPIKFMHHKVTKDTED
jgi:hypothetical protein